MKNRAFAALFRRAAFTNALVSWTPPTWGWHLEETPGLNPAAWTNSPTGESNPVTVSTTNPATFYRLKNQ